jgi:hypothetical protein
MTPTGTKLAVLFGLALALGGCGTNLLGSSSTNIFGSSKATTDNKGAAGVGGEANPSTPDMECPEVNVRSGASTLMIGSKPGTSEPSALDLRYQGTIVRTARECHVSAGVMTMKVGIEGRVITGPAGAPGTVDVPLRIAVVKEGVEPKPIVSKFARLTVTMTAAVDRVTFTHIEPDIAFPLPQPLGDIDSYVVYVGFDPGVAPPEKKKPAGKPRPKPKGAAKPAAKPQG